MLRVVGVRMSVFSARDKGVVLKIAPVAGLEILARFDRGHMPAVSTALGIPPPCVLPPRYFRGGEITGHGANPKGSTFREPWEDVRSGIDLQARVACTLTVHTDRIFSGTPICPQYSILERP